MTLKTMGETVVGETSESTSASVDELNLLDILAILLVRKRFIGLITLAATLLTAIIVFILPNMYTAESVVLPPTQNSSLSSALLGQLGGSGALASMAGASLGIKNPADMYVALFRSRTVEDTLIERFGLMARYHKKNMFDTRKKFEDRTSVILGAKDGLIRVEVTDRDPKFAAQLANAYVDEFRKHSDSLTMTESSQRRAFFEQQLKEADGNLAKAEQEMKGTEQSTGVLQLDSQARALIESAAVLRGQIAAKEVQLQSMRSFATEDNPQYVMAQQELGALKTQLAKMAGPGAGESQDIGLSKTNIPEAGMTYLNALRDMRYYETMDELIAKQFEMAKLDEARQGVVEISDVAVPPDKKSSPHRALIVLVVAIVSFFVACTLCIFTDRLKQLKNHSEGREQLSALRGALH
jgi:tyrosine-protein kinase Etk/Wzc